VKIRSPIVRKRARLEIIPLIDIMFFLLASFMMVSLQMQKVRTLKASLPTATLATSTTKPDMIKIKVGRDGAVSLDNNRLTFPELYNTLTNRHHVNTNVPVFLSGSRDATHGEMVYVLDLVHRAGIDRVAFAVKADPASSAGRP
jgi:biopolymer transport protein ExbD